MWQLTVIDRHTSMSDQAIDSKRQASFIEIVERAVESLLEAGPSLNLLV
jgi:hypothetical protein